MDQASANTKKGMSKKTKIILLCVIALVVIALVVAGILFSRNLAGAMRVLKLEGGVTLEDADGTTRSITGNLRLQSGNALSTAADGLVSVGMDRHKIVTLQENSRAEVRKTAKWLQLFLTKGSVFFQVNKALADDETFDIRTSTMIVGIRGTSGYVSVDEDGHETLVLTDGHVEVVGTNPTTKEQKTITVHAGQKIKVYLYNERPVNSIEFELTEATPEDLPQKVLEIISEDGGRLGSERDPGAGERERERAGHYVRGIGAGSERDARPHAERDAHACAQAYAFPEALSVAQTEPDARAERECEPESEPASEPDARAGSG